MAGRRKQKNQAGLNSRNYPKPIRPFVDVDYAQRLTDEERTWLATFLDGYYGGDFRASDDGQWPQDERRKTWVSLNGIRRDAYAVAQAGECLDQTDEDPRSTDTAGSDETPTPEYLNSEEYKAARAEFRANLAPGPRPTKPAETLRFLVSRKKLTRVVDKGARVRKGPKADE